MKLIVPKNGKLYKARGYKNIIKTYSIERVVDALKEISLSVSSSLRAYGFVSYNASSAFDDSFPVSGSSNTPLLYFVIVDINDFEEYVPPSNNTFPRFNPMLTYEEYEKSFLKIREHLKKGNTYQINLTMPFLADMPIENKEAYFASIYTDNPTEYALYIEDDVFAILSFSPEMFFSCVGGKIISKPMKGTALRKQSEEEDLLEKEKLFLSEKNRAENLMIVDMLRNDLSKIAESSSVCVPSLFEIEKYPSVWQMTSTVEAKTKEGIVSIFKALFPCASITGAPKKRAIELISKIEKHERGVYTGAIGYMDKNTALFNVAIRTLVVDTKTDRSLYFAGGGIVWDSTAKEEWGECFSKVEILNGKAKEFFLLESILIENGEYFLLDLHLKRMRNSALYFNFMFNEEGIREALSEASKNSSHPYEKLRLLLSKNGRVCFEVSKIDLPEKKPFTLEFAPFAIDSTSVYLKHKTTNREIYQKVSVLSDADNVILYNERAEICETTTNNIAVEIDGILYTPALSSSLLNGTMREKMLEEGILKEKTIYLCDIRKERKTLVINSVRGVREATVMSYYNKTNCPFVKEGKCTCLKY